jgi:hypothetical protein
MKNFKEYLTESKKEYIFKVKIAGDVTTEQETHMKRALGRFTVADTLESMKKSKTPIQAVPLDFPQIRNCEVNIFEFTLDYPTTQQELTEYLSAELNISKQKLVVRRPGEPSEEYQTPSEERKGALLDDPDYKEAGTPQFEDYYGDKYNSGFVKELNDILKLQRKERNEIIPNASSNDIIKNPGKTTNDLPQNNLSPVRQRDYNPIRK